jgi:hypothetical protein
MQFPKTITSFLTVATMLGTCTLSQAAAWTAYVDFEMDSTRPGNVVNFSAHGGPTHTVTLKDYASGTVLTGITATMNGTWTNDARVLANFTAGTDAANIFGGIVNPNGYIHGDVLHDGQNAAHLVISGLDPSLRYEIALVGNRSDNAGRNTVYRLEDVESYLNLSSTGVIGNTATIDNGENTFNGYVARFVDIDPGINGSFTVYMGLGNNRWYTNAFMVSAVPEPGALSLLGLAGVGLMRRRGAR